MGVVVGMVLDVAVPVALRVKVEVNVPVGLGVVLMVSDAEEGPCRTLGKSPTTIPCGFLSDLWGNARRSVRAPCAPRVEPSTTSECRHQTRTSEPPVGVGVVVHVGVALHVSVVVAVGVKVGVNVAVGERVGLTVGDAEEGNCRAQQAASAAMPSK